MALAGWAAPAPAADFRAVGEAAAILYDAPSAHAHPLFILGRGYPVEVVIALENWIKVRDADGTLAWVEDRLLSTRRTLMVRVPVAQVRAAADDGAPVVFEAAQSVLLDLTEFTGGWARVTGAGGASGYIRLDQVWGA